MHSKSHMHSLLFLFFFFFFWGGFSSFNIDLRFCLYDVPEGKNLSAGDKLYYFPNPSSTEPRGVINVADVTKVIIHKPHSKTNREFQIVTTNRTYHLQATSKEDLQNWITKLEELREFVRKRQELQLSPRSTS